MSGKSKLQKSGVVSAFAKIGRERVKGPNVMLEINPKPDVINKRFLKTTKVGKIDQQIRQGYGS